MEPNKFALPLLMVHLTETYELSNEDGKILKVSARLKKNMIRVGSTLNYFLCGQPHFF
jgi:hypothetical protein